MLRQPGANLCKVVPPVLLPREAVLAFPYEQGLTRNAEQLPELVLFDLTVFNPFPFGKIRSLPEPAEASE